MRGTHLRAQRRPANSMDQDSFDSYEDSFEEMLALTAGNLNVSGSPANDQTGNTEDEEEEKDELPKSLIVTNVDLSVFDDQSIKLSFETMFREFESSPTFHYLRSFRRIRVDFDSHLTATKAKAGLDGTVVADNPCHIFFIQVPPVCRSEEAFLHVPPLTKQFLISPPCSPPVGWEQPKEAKPVVDYDLLAAMAQLAPGENHELHPSKMISVLGKSVSTPSIVVQVCGVDQAEGGVEAGVGCGGGGGGATSKGVKIPQTRCPERKASLDY